LATGEPLDVPPFDPPLALDPLLGSVEPLPDPVPPLLEPGGPEEVGELHERKSTPKTIIHRVMFLRLSPILSWLLGVLHTPEYRARIAVSSVW
jgi:hypothetical protein